MTDYPDLSQPMSGSQENGYPDLSQPAAGTKGADGTSLWEKYQNFMQPKTTDQSGHPMVETFLGRMPDPRYQENRNAMMKAPTQQDMDKTAGVMTMLLGPEVKLGAMLPQAIRAGLPKLSGAAKLAADYVGGIAKTGASGYAGSKMMGADDEQATVSGLTGAGLNAVTTPLMMLTSSMNPLARMLAGTGLGSLAGYGVSKMTGEGSPYATGAGGVAGALLGLRGRGAGELARQNVAEAVTPEQQTLATQRQAAAQQIGVPLTAAEATGSPVLGAMQQEAAGSVGGSKVLYPFGLNRQKAEEQAYDKLLNQISPKNAKEGIEDQAFKTAFANAEQQGTKVDVQPVIKYIDDKLPQYEKGSKMASALRQAKDRLSLTPQSEQKYQQIMAPITQIEQGLQKSGDSLKAQMQTLQENPPESYFRASTGYDQKVSALQSQIDQHEAMMKQVADAKQKFVQDNKIGNYENTVEGLHNAKMGIQGLIEGQGDQAIGRTASGQLKQVNKRLTQQIKDVSPEYAAATQISNLRQARETIENSMAKSGLSGSNFYDKVLTNRNEYNSLYERLGNPNTPKVQTLAQKNLEAMRTAFPDLIDSLTAKSGQALATSHPEIGSSFKGLAKSFINKIYMDRYNKAIAELMINPRWQDELRSVSMMKAGEDRGIRLGRLISKVATAGVAANNSQQGSEQYGTGQ